MAQTWFRSFAGSLAYSQKANPSHASVFHMFVSTAETSTICLLHDVAHSHELQLIHALMMCLAPAT